MYIIPKNKITRLDELRYMGTAGDIVGTAQGRFHGNAVRWCYDMDIVVANKSHRLRFDDWMWQLDGSVVVNRSYMKTFGLTVAELTLFMQKQS